MLAPRHWQDAAASMIGVGLLLSPWVGRYGGDLVAVANAMITVSFIALVALGASVLPRPWEPWAQALLGLWLVASPWALGFEAHEMPMSTAVALGAVVVGLAAWVLVDIARESGEPDAADRR